MRPEIRPTRGSNPRPRGATQEPQPSRLRTFRIKFGILPALFLVLFLVNIGIARTEGTKAEAIK
jgi:hypothetical protein